MPVSLIRDWEEANGNRIAIYVYQICRVELLGAGDEWVTLLRRPPGHIKFEEEVKLLLYQGHYSLVLDFQKLICRQKNMSIRPYDGHTATMACHRCFRYFKKKEKLEAHLARWDCMDDSTPCKANKSLPQAEEDGSPAMDVFKKFQHMIFHQCVIPADFETNWDPDDKCTKLGEKTLLLGRNKHVISAAYSAVGSEGFEIPPEHQMWLYRGPDPVRVFLINLLKLYRVYYEAKSNPMKIIMTDADVEIHTSATRCGYCNSKFKSFGPLVKCADHNHFTGAYRTAACSSCNSKARLSNDIIILFHNGGGYDFHFIVRAIADLQSSAIGEMTIHEFNTGVATPDMKMKIKDMRVEVIAKTAERYMEIRFGPLIFRDSMNFVKKGLAAMIVSQRKVSSDASLAFPITARLHPQASIDLDLLLQKIPFPYASMRDDTCFHLPAVLPQSCYDNDISVEKCSDETYQLVKHICETFGFTTLLNITMPISTVMSCFWLIAYSPFELLSTRKLALIPCIVCLCLEPRSKRCCWLLVRLQLNLFAMRTVDGTSWMTSTTIFEVVFPTSLCPI